MAEKKIKSFTEMKKQDSISYSEIVDCLWDYAQIGADISGQAVISLIDRCNSPNGSDDDVLIAFLPPLRHGQQRQFENFHDLAAAEYRVVIQHIKDKVGLERAKII
jgi:hypothetical protein